MPNVPKPPKPEGVRSFSRFYRASYGDNWIYQQGDFPFAVARIGQRSGNPVINGFRYPSSYYALYYRVNREDGIRWTSPTPIPPPTADTIYGPAAMPNQEYFGELMTINLTPVWPINTKNRLDTELLNKIAANRASYGESLAEMNKTISHLAKTARSLAQAYLAARKGNFGGVAKALGVSRKRNLSGKSSAEKWLEYQYAWLPLMADATNTAELIKEGFRKEKFLMSSTRQLSDQHSIDTKVSDSNWIEEVKGSSSAIYKAKVFYRPSDTIASRLNQIGLLNPLSLAWALQPFSFVVDWFVPIGNVLDAFTATVGCEFVAGFYGIRVQGTYTTKPYFYVPPWRPYSENTVQTVTDFLTYQRIGMTGFPTPALYAKNPFSTTHVLSALALIRQLLK